MECIEVEEQIPAYAAGALPLDAVARIEAHVAHCASCQIWLDEAVELLDFWQSDQTDLGATPDLVASVMQAIAEAPAPFPVEQPPAQSLKQSPATRRASRWVQGKSVLLHYGVAASLAFALFHFGLFTQIGPESAALHALIVGKLQGLIVYAINM